jgi:hypothetical protein
MVAIGGVAGVWEAAWFQCSKCASLFRADADLMPFTALPPETGGTCRAGGQHDASGNQQLAVLVGAAGVNAQGGWHRCANCSEFFWGPTGTSGVCPATLQHHTSDGGESLLVTVDTGDPATQPGWRRCLNCFALFLEGASGNVCPANSGGHAAASKGSLPAPFHPGGGGGGSPVPKFAVVLDHSNFLPHGRACAPGATVDLKVNTHTIVGWLTVCSGTWDTSPQNAWQLAFNGGDTSDGAIVTKAVLSFQTDPHGALIISELAMVLSANAQSFLKSHVSADQASVLTTALTALSLGELGAGKQLPCATFFAGSFDDAEYDDGNNNNGVGTIATSTQFGVQLWPKREDRIRLDALLAGTNLNLELDTHE